MKPKQLKSSDIKSVREKILKEQNGLCLICGQVPKRPCLDHSHQKRIKGTGKIRGVLCSQCNILVGKNENNCSRYGVEQKRLPNILRSIASFLERPHYNMLHPSEAPKPKKLTKRSYIELKKAYDLNYTGRAKLPAYPKSKKLTKSLEKFYVLLDIKPKYYKT